MASQGHGRSITSQFTLSPATFSPRLAQPAYIAAMAGAVQRRKLATRSKHSPSLWHQPSLRDLRFELYIHLPGHSELERLTVHRSQSLVSLQAALQRQFDLPFEQQRLFFQSEELQGDDDLSDYGLQDKSVVMIRLSSRFRRIGDVFSTIRTIQFSSSTSREDYELVEIPAGLPPLRIVFQRIVNAITYLTTLDRMQAQRTHRRVWRQHVTFWDEPTAPTPSAPPRHSSDLSRPRRLHLAPSSADKGPASYVLQTSSTEHVASILALANAHGVQSRLQRPPANRSSSDLRNLKKWLASLKYFADARLPDAIFQELARSSTYLRVNSGEFVFRQGETGDSFYILITGCVSLAAYSTGFFRTLTPGSCFGEISLIEPQGLRMASACVTFATTWAELALVPGDLYRRAIKPYKQVVLHATETAIASIPRMHALPPHIITHLAYAATSLTAREGRLVVCRGEEISVLVLLVQGSVKVAKPPLHGQPLVAVIQAPAVLGQEGALATTTAPAPWEIVALDTCLLLCLRKDTIASFLSPVQDVVRALMAEHFQRLRDFNQRFHPDRHRPSREASRLSSPRDSTSSHTRNNSLIFPQILVRDDTVLGVPAASRLDELARPVTTDDRDLLRRRRQHSPRKRPATQSSTRSPACAEVEAQYLSRVLPFDGIVSLQTQLRYVSFDPPEQKESTPDPDNNRDQKTTALLHGLRRLPPQDVCLLPVVYSTSPRINQKRQYHFGPLNSPQENKILQENSRR